MTNVAKPILKIEAGTLNVVAEFRSVTHAAVCERLSRGSMRHALENASLVGKHFYIFKDEEAEDEWAKL